MKWFAPAKINLSLRVLGRREDGFHEIETLMAPLSLADEITVTLDLTRAAGEIELNCDDPSLPTGDGNLAHRAAASFWKRTGVPTGAIRIDLLKRIPHGAGLGGGSSDAATVLLALNELCAHPLNITQLATLAAELGSDVPFFVYRGPAYCRGRGERIEHTTFATELSLFLIKPPFPVPTTWAYQRWKDSRELSGVRYSPQVFGWGELVNDLERPVFEKYLLLPEIKTWLLAQPEVSGALLSGSGSTMVCVFDARPGNAEALSQKVRVQFGDVWTCSCKTVTLSP